MGVALQSRAFPLADCGREGSEVRVIIDEDLFLVAVWVWPSSLVPSPSLTVGARDRRCV